MNKGISPARGAQTALRLGFAAIALAFLIGVSLSGSVSPAGGAKAKKAKPDLKVTKVKVKGAKTPLAPGSKIKVADTVANRGDKASGKSETRFYLSRDVKASLAERRKSKTDPRTALVDLLLRGDRAVPKLDPGETSTVKKKKKKPTAAALPETTPAGKWFVLACADDSANVREKAEHNNCKAAKNPIEVTTTVFVAGSQGYAHSDAFDRDPLPAGLEAALIGLNREDVCTPDAKLRNRSYSKALKSLDRFLVKNAGKPALKMFAKSPEAKKAEAAANAAGAALLDGNPGAALVAILRAHELKPKSGTTLVNAAVAATNVGMPNEALGLLEQAATLDPPKKGPHLSFSALLAHARGHALVALGKYAEAEDAANAAQSLEPFLETEAANLLAASRLCRNDDAAAVNFRKRSKVRKDPPPNPPADESAGEASELRNVPFPALPTNAAAMAGFFLELSAKVRDEMIATSQQESQLSNQASALDQDANLATRLRREGLLRLVRSADDRFEAEWKTVTSAVLDSHEVRYEYFVDGQVQGRVWDERDEAAAACEGADDYSACVDEEWRNRCRPSLKNYHSAWLNDISRAYSAAQQWYRQVSRAASGVAANIKSPVHHELAMIEIGQRERDPIGLIAQSAEYWTDEVEGIKENCIDDPEPPTTEQPAGPTDAKGEPCPPELKNVKWSATIAEGKTAAGRPWKIGLSGNCEEISGEGSVEIIPWLEAFAGVSHSRVSGETMLVVGPRASMGAGPVKTSFESTAFIRQRPNVTPSGLVDYDNPTVIDMGWRGGPSAGVSGPEGLVEYGSSGLEELVFVGGITLAR